MSEFNKDDFPLLFAEVAKVLGEEEANKQLGIAYNSYSGDYLIWDNRYLMGAFAWEYTIQGHGFWYDVSRGVYPNV